MGNQGNNPMNQTEQYLEHIVIDLCGRSFLLISNDGEEKIVECETPEEFMNVFLVVKDRVDEDSISYCDVAVYKSEN